MPEQGNPMPQTEEMLMPTMAQNDTLNQGVNLTTIDARQYLTEAEETRREERFDDQKFYRITEILRSSNPADGLEYRQRLLDEVCRMIGIQVI